MPGDLQPQFFTLSGDVFLSQFTRLNHDSHGEMSDIVVS